MHDLCQIRVIFNIRRDQLFWTLNFVALSCDYHLLSIDWRSSFAMGLRLSYWITQDTLHVASWVGSHFEHMHSHFLRLSVFSLCLMLDVPLLLWLLSWHSYRSFLLQSIFRDGSNSRSIGPVTATLAMKLCLPSCVLTPLRP